MAAVREHSDSFAEWRHALAAGLAVIDDLPADEPDWVLHARAILHEELAWPRERILSELRNSGTLDVSRVAAATLGVEAAGVGATAAVAGGLVAGLAGGVATAIAKAAAAYLADRRKIRLNHALLDHYLTFDVHPLG